MAWRKTKIVAVIGLAGVILLFSWAAVFVIVQRVMTGGGYSSNNRAERPETPFKFTQRTRQGRGTGPAAANSNGAGLANFTSDIPIMVLRSQGAGYVSYSKEFSTFRMEIYEPAGQEPARFGSKPTVTTRVGLRVRGMLSRSFPKLSYRLKVENEAGGKFAQPLLGMPEDDDWVLQGPWLDKSLIRNAFSYDLATAMGCSGMRSRPCEVFLSTSGQPVTEADYLGVYQLTEHIDRGKERVNVKKLEPNQNLEPEITGGYILAWDAGEGNYLPSWEPWNGRASLQLHYPKNPSPAQLHWIDKAFTHFDQVMRGEDYRDPANGYAAYIDVDAWVNYILFEELIFNLDAYDRSFYLQKDRGGKIRPGPVWDHDLALGHQLPRGTRFTDWWFYRRPRPNHWITQLVRDPAFWHKMEQRWAVLRKGVLSDQQMAARVDTFATPLLTGAADRNFERWPILNMRIPPHRLRNITIATDTFPEQITALKQFLRQRAAWMDQNLQGSL